MQAENEKRSANFSKRPFADYARRAVATYVLLPHTDVEATAER